MLTLHRADLYTPYYTVYIHSCTYMRCLYTHSYLLILILIYIIHYTILYYIHRFLQACLTDYQSIIDLITPNHINIETSNTTNILDKERIQDYIYKTIGYKLFNISILNILKSWLIKRLRSAIYEVYDQDKMTKIKITLGMYIDMYIYILISLYTCMYIICIHTHTVIILT